METFQVNTLVIGAGVVGLAVARALSQTRRDVWLIEKQAQIGAETSSRNSEVIHAGIYYPRNSLKARLCVEGKVALYAYCEDRGIPHARIGKLIVATSEDQLSRLPEIANRAEANGVFDLEYLDDRQVCKLEPELSAKGALLSPSTGIIDSHLLMQSLLHDAECNGAQLVTTSEIRFIDGAPGRYRLELVGQNAIVEAKTVVNAAGLYAPWLLRGNDWFPQDQIPDAAYAKGNYFSYSGSVPFKHLIYPVPEKGGLGVHLTLDLAGAGKFGPDVQWSDIRWQNDIVEFDYRVDESRLPLFAQKVRAYWPTLDPSRLMPSYSGLRPKLGHRDALYPDFCIQGERDHGIAGLVNLFGIESPGLTSSLAIARYVVDLLED